MSYQNEKSTILEMLETGKINPQEATNLLEALAPRKRTLRLSPSPDKVTFEIDANQDNLGSVLKKLSRAITPKA